MKQFNHIRFFFASHFSSSHKVAKSQPPKLGTTFAIKKIELNLPAYGVEADSFPNILAIVDLQNDSSYCDVSYYDPKFKATSYRLTKESMDSVRLLIAQFNVRSLKPKYEVSLTDLSTSTAIFYFVDTTVQIIEYGLMGPSPLKELYRIVYKRK